MHVSMTPQTKQQSIDSTDTAAVPMPVAITKQVAAKAGVDPLDLPPLHTAIDGDALTALVDHHDASTNLEITFSYEGYTVTVTGDGAVSVHE